MQSAVLNHRVTVEIFCKDDSLWVNTVKLLTIIAERACKNLADATPGERGPITAAPLSYDPPTSRAYKVEVGLNRATTLDAHLWGCHFAAQMSTGCQVYMEILPDKTSLGITTLVPRNLWLELAATT